MQEEAKPGEREERERRRKEQEEWERRLAELASQYGTRITVGDKMRDLQNADLGELAENAKEYVRRKPGQALLISAGVGFLLGLILRGRR
jgi:ElaB/YqjD/DUF883 family membrane-anchored ribosome-binding protein